MNIRIAIALLLLCAGVVIGCAAQDSATGNVIGNSNDGTDPILIGFIGPLSGDLAEWGNSQKNVVQMAVDDINTQGGIDGRRLEVIYEDGKCAGKDAATAANKLVNIDHVDVLLPFCSAEVLSSAPIAEEHRVVLLAVAANAPSITSAGDYIFRSCYSDEDTAAAAANVLRDYATVGIIYEQTAYGQGWKEALDAEYDGLLVAEGFSQGSKDLRAQIIKVLAAHPDAIVLDPDSATTGIPLLRQLHELGYRGPLYGNFFGGNPEVLSSPYAQGMIYLSDPDLPDRSSAFLDEYRRRFGKDVLYPYFGAAEYDGVRILEQAMRKAQHDGTDLKSALYATRYEGLLGNYSFDANGDAHGPLPAAKQIRDGNPVPYASTADNSSSTE